MKNTSSHSGRAVLSGAVPLLSGISWRGLGLVALLYGLWVLQAILAPASPIFGGAGVGLLSTWFSLWVSMLVGGASMFVAVVVVLNAAAQRGLSQGWIVFPAALVGALAATVVSRLAGSAPVGLGGMYEGIGAIAFWADWAVAVAVGYLVLLRVRAAREGTQQLELQRKALETRQIEARLHTLQAQIEPHFLFNTLSNIRRLAKQDLSGGRAMLAQLARYLQAALPKIRRDRASLADEIELAQAYLDLQKIRMGERLQVSIAVRKADLTASIPPMMLVTLVENAIKHGIAPLPQGGSVSIEASREGDILILSVSDTGRGFIAESGSGVGLSNLRARLSMLYGDRASLRLQAGLPQGVRASIALPWQELREGR